MDGTVTPPYRRRDGRVRTLVHPSVLQPVCDCTTTGQIVGFRDHNEFFFFPATRHCLYRVRLELMHAFGERGMSIP